MEQRSLRLPLGPAHGVGQQPYGAGAGIGASLGLVVGGAMAEWVSRRAGFFINVPIGIAMVFAALKFPFLDELIELVPERLSKGPPDPLKVGFVFTDPLRAVFEQDAVHICGEDRAVGQQVVEFPLSH